MHDTCLWLVRILLSKCLLTAVVRLGWIKAMEACFYIYENLNYDIVYGYL